jgi:cellulose synthase/poly-beta-1,6-N-acetylglucosamine synthase-like glycosyltransferase
MAVFWLLTLFQHRKILDKDPAPKRFPPLSIIVPAYNEEDSIASCVDSLLRLDYPAKISVIVVNDGSTDKTHDIAAKYAKKGLITLVDKPNGGKASAMNAGLKHVKTDYVLCMDADSIVSPNALHYMMGYFDDAKVGAVTAALKVTPPKNRLQEIQWIEYLVNVLQRKLFAVIDILYVTPGPFSVYRAKALRDIGGFDEHNLTEDMEVALHLQEAGWRLENSMQADVFTETPMTMYGLFSQRVRWYRGLIQNLRKYRHMILSRKHGLLGLFLLPATILLIIVSLVGAALFVSSIAESTYNFLLQLWFMATIGFNWVFEIDLAWMLFSTNLFVLVLSGFVLLTTFVILYMSHKLSRERLAWPKRAAYAVFVLIYFLLLASVWAFSIFKEITGAEREW